jgi:ArsR family transcriptional regulator
MPAAAPLVDAFSALADATRCRMLLLLDRHELTVGELCAVLQLPQSTVSRQLKTLGDAGWVSSRRDGTSRYYSLSLDGGGGHAGIWEVARRQWAGRPAVEQDARRLSRALARRNETSQRFFASAAGRWDRLREDLFGADFPARAMLSLVPREWAVADLGCGTGAFLALVAPHVRRAAGVDASEEMLAAARARTADLAHVELHRGSLEAPPLPTGAFDLVTMMLVLHHLPSPALALEQAARLLAPGGRLLVVDMAPHEHEEYRQQMGHVWLGFGDDQIRRLLQQAGLADIRIDPLPVSTEAKGPGLWAATGKI